MSTREFMAIRSILAKALLKAREPNVRHIAALQLALGEISELDRHSMQKHWDELSRGTAAERAQLHFRLIQAESQCMACFKKIPSTGWEDPLSSLRQLMGQNLRGVHEVFWQSSN